MIYNHLCTRAGTENYIWAPIPTSISMLGTIIIAVYDGLTMLYDSIIIIIYCIVMNLHVFTTEFT